MFTVILAADSNEERVSAQAKAVANYPAHPEEFEVIIVHVAREIQSDEGGQIRIEDYSELPESVLKAISTLEAEGIDAHVKERSGDPDEEILRAAREANADHIVLGGRRRTPVGKAVFGSVVQDVIRNADRPVLTVNASE